MASDTSISSATFESRLVTLETNFAVFVQEMKDFKEEMREFKSDMKNNLAANQTEMQNIGRHVRNITIASMVGIGAMALSGGAIAVAVVYSVFNFIPK